MKMVMKCRIFVAVVAGMVSAACFAAPKYIFYFIGDGMSTPQRMVAEEFSRKAGLGSLAINQLPVQSTARTCSTSSLVTDSAAAATALACGKKTYNGASGVDDEGNRLVSCAEIAHKIGKKIGIITTVTLTHATPAGFYAHRKSRGDTYGIAIDLADSGFDFFAGGGFGNKHADAEAPEFAACGDAYDYAESKGYRIVKTKDEFMALGASDGKIVTRFTDEALAYSIDGKPGEPTLSEMVAKAIEVLDNPQGFFIMAEGGRIDWAGHANDAASNLRDVLAFDDAVKTALAFLEKHPDDTLVVVTGDHETGGLSMGFAGTGYALYVDRLVNQTMSVDEFNRRTKMLHAEKPDATFDDFKPLIEQAFGFRFEGDAAQDPMVLDDAERSAIETAFAKGGDISALGDACRLVIAHKAGLGWSSGAHTAMPALTTAAGVDAWRFTGFMENSELGVRMKELCGAQ